MVFRNPDYAKAEHRRRQHHEPAGYHTDKRTYRCNNRIVESVALHEIFHAEQRYSERNDDNRHRFDDFVKAVSDNRNRFFDIFRAGADFHCEIVHTDVFDACLCAPRYNETARHKFIARVFADSVGFARN